MTTMGDELDNEILLGVLNELRWDSRVTPAEVGVEVAAGVVTLTGEVATMTKKLAAEEAARLVSGVKEVDNRMTVRGHKAVEREELAAAFEDAFEWDTYTPMPGNTLDEELRRELVSGKPRRGGN